MLQLNLKYSTTYRLGAKQSLQLAHFALRCFKVEQPSSWENFHYIVTTHNFNGISHKILSSRYVRKGRCMPQTTLFFINWCLGLADHWHLWHKHGIFKCAIFISKFLTFFFLKREILKKGSGIWYFLNWKNN